MENEKIITGTCWSSDENQTFYYRITLTKENAKRILKLMDVYANLIEPDKDLEDKLDLHEIVAWDAEVQVFNDEELTDEQYCAVCKVRVQENSCCWELKDKYCANVYETMDEERQTLEDFIKEIA